MGNVHHLCHFENAPEMALCDDVEKAVLQQTSFADWNKKCHHLDFGFPAPCLEFHNQTQQYNINSCYSLEVKVDRRRSIQFRNDLTQYTAELERLGDGRQNLHVRDTSHQICTCSNNHVTVIPLIKVSAQVPELDFMFEPILNVIAYQKNVLAITVQEKTKRIPKLLIFVDIAQCQEIGSFVAQLNYSNLSGVRIDCAINDDASCFVLYFLEDHYDEFHAHFHAVIFNEDCKPITICKEKFATPMWYDTGLHMAFLPKTADSGNKDEDNCREKIVILCEKQGQRDVFQIPGREPTRCLMVYDLHQGIITKAIELNDKLYPVHIKVSPDAMYVATMSRDPSVWSDTSTVNWEDRTVEYYVTKIYDAENLCLRMQISTPLTMEVFNKLSHCNKIIFSLSGQLMALPSCGQVDEEFIDYEFGSYVVSTATHDVDKVTMTVYRLPIINLSLKALCRDAVLNECAYKDVNKLQLPAAIVSYLMYMS